MPAFPRANALSFEWENTAVKSQRKYQVCLLVLSILLSSLPVTGFTQEPVTAPTPANPQTNEAFKFSKVDLDLLEQVNLLDGFKVTVNDLIVRASALALRAHPKLNATFHGNSVRYYDSADISVAVAIPDGLITPIVAKAHTKNLKQIGDEVRALAEQHHIAPASPIVFEGNAPADIRENDLLRVARLNPPAAAPTASRCWLGAPNSIKGPTEAVFQRQSGNHLLIVGQREDAALTMLGLALLALAAQHPRGTARFLFLLNAAPGSPESDFIEKIIAASGHDITLARAHDIPAVMSDIAADLKARTTGAEPALFLFIHGLHKFKKLRHEDDFSFSSGGDGDANPGAQLTDIITEGSALGVHILTSIDTFNNVNRSMSRKALSEFEMRVVFQMSVNDSASLIDSPKASTLGLHRSLFYNEHEGTLETFRPYAAPDAEWLAKASK